jgi:hypothetical protein
MHLVSFGDIVRKTKKLSSHKNLPPTLKRMGVVDFRLDYKTPPSSEDGKTSRARERKHSRPAARRPSYRPRPDDGGNGRGEKSRELGDPEPADPRRGVHGNCTSINTILSN